MYNTIITLMLLASAWAQNDSTSACPTGNGVHIIVARASLEPPGYGTIGTVKDSVLSRIPGSTAEAVVYPATLNDYVDSETQGVIAMKALITQYVDNCDSPFVLMGYSQGAQVTLDSLVGQDDQGFPDNSTVDQPLSDDILSQLGAVVVMGDPTFQLNETFHVGNATRNGDFPRLDVSRFSSDLSAKIQSYCDEGDLFCAGGNSIPIHVGYVAEYGQQAADFVVSQIAPNSTSSSSSTVSAKASATASGTTATRSASFVTASATALPTPSSTPSSIVTATGSSTAPTTSSTLTPSPGAASRFGLNILAMCALLGLSLFI